MLQGLPSWMFEGGFKVSSGAVEWHIGGYGTDFDHSKISEPLPCAAFVFLARLTGGCGYLVGPPPTHTIWLQQLSRTPNHHVISPHPCINPIPKYDPDRP